MSNTVEEIDKLEAKIYAQHEKSVNMMMQENTLT